MSNSISTTPTSPFHEGQVVLVYDPEANLDKGEFILFTVHHVNEQGQPVVAASMGEMWTFEFEGIGEADGIRRYYRIEEGKRSDLCWLAYVNPIYLNYNQLGLQRTQAAFEIKNIPTPEIKNISDI